MMTTGNGVYVRWVILGKNGLLYDGQYRTRARAIYYHVYGYFDHEHYPSAAERKAMWQQRKRAGDRCMRAELTLLG